MAHEQPSTECSHGPWQEGPYGRRCRACGRIELSSGYNDFFMRDVRRGRAPYCAICGERMDEVHLMDYRCTCGFEKRYKPPINSRIDGLAGLIRVDPSLKRIFYETELADIPHPCFICDYGVLHKAGELLIRCDCCGLIVKRDNDEVSFTTYFSQSD